MPRGGPPPWRMRTTNLDHYLQASMAQAGGVFDPVTGWYAVLKDTGHKTRDDAMVIQRGLYASGRFVKVSVHCQIIAEEDGTYSVVFKAINRAHAKAYLLTKYGTDKQNWPYRPGEKDKKE